RRTQLPRCRRWSAWLLRSRILLVRSGAVHPAGPGPTAEVGLADRVRRYDPVIRPRHGTGGGGDWGHVARARRGVRHRLRSAVAPRAAPTEQWAVGGAGRRVRPAGRGVPRWSAGAAV